MAEVLGAAALHLQGGAHEERTGRGGGAARARGTRSRSWRTTPAQLKDYSWLSQVARCTLKP